MSITQAQRRMLHAARRQLGMDEETYRNVLVWAAGVDSSTELDQVGFALVVQKLEQLGFKNTARKTLGMRPGMATDAQIGMIRRLWCEWSRDGSEAGLGTFLERTAKVSSVRFLTAQGAAAVIAALKKMVERRRHDQAPPAA